MTKNSLSFSVFGRFDEAPKNPWASESLWSSCIAKGEVQVQYFGN